MQNPWGVDEAAAVGVCQSDLHAVGLDGAQGIEEVIHVEADLDLFTLVGDFDLIFRFLLLRVVSLEREEIRPHRQPYAPVLLVGENGGALQRLPQGLAVRFHGARWTRRYDPRVLRETTIDQL